MFQEPANFKENDHFFFQANQKLEIECNAPKDKEGVFKIIELRNGSVNLVYIGYTKYNGLYDEIVNGLHYTKESRSKALKTQLTKDRADAVDIYWYVTDNRDNPKKQAEEMLEDFSSFTGQMPKWNK
ncbi:MAG: hypothetical protein ACXIUD_11515 [Mongoliitalea sp.]